jgi:hypothetical protein
MTTGISMLLQGRMRYITQTYERGLHKGYSISLETHGDLVGAILATGVPNC